MKQLFTITFLFVLAAGLTFAQTAEKKVDKNVAQANVKTNSTTSTNAVTYDFTQGDGSQFYGGPSGAVELEAGVWGMIAGDVDQNGGVGSSDLISTRTDLGLTNYNVNDVDMNGGVGSSDLILVRQNLGRITQLP